MTGDFEMNGKSIVFRAVLRSTATMIRPDGLLRGHLLVLTSIRSRNYHSFVMGGIDSELFRKECRGARKSKSLSLTPQSGHLSTRRLETEGDNQKQREIPSILAWRKQKIKYLKEKTEFLTPALSGGHDVKWWADRSTSMLGGGL